MEQDPEKRDDDEHCHGTAKDEPEKALEALPFVEEAKVQGIETAESF